MLASVIDPVALVTETPVPAVIAARLKLEPLPISNWPLVGDDEFPVPPLSTLTGVSSENVVAVRLRPLPAV